MMHRNARSSAVAVVGLLLARPSFAQTAKKCPYIVSPETGAI